MVVGEPLLLGMCRTTLVVQSLSVTWCCQRSRVLRAAMLGGDSMPSLGVL